MKYLLSITMIAMSVLLIAETDTTALIDCNCKRDFDNQGQQEQCWTLQLFRTEYKATKYPKFNGQVVRENNTFRFGEDEISLSTSNPEFIPLLEQALLYPEMFGSFLNDEKPGKKLGIYIVGEIDTPNMPRGAKRFKFWLGREGFSNPTVYFIELRNKDADPGDLKSFVNGSSLTFFHYGWVII